MDDNIHTLFLRASPFAMLITAFILSPIALAQDNPPQKEAATNALILEQVGNEGTGVLHINQTSADGANQGNVLAVATVANSGAALADATSSQIVFDLNIFSSGDSLTSNFANAANGVVGLNQSAAAGSAQANVVALAISNDPASFADASANNFMSAQTSNALGNMSGARIDNFGNGAVGIVQANQLAGVGGQQANVFALALAGDGIASANASALMNNIGDATDQPAEPYPTQAGSVGLNDSFAGASGVVQINQAAGGNNIQSNLIAAAFGAGAIASAISESGLSDIRTAPSALSDDDIALDGDRVIVSGSLDGFTGVGQVSLVSGYGNQTSNNISVSISHAPIGQ